MRVCIIGLDGLEYTLVEKFQLENLLQKEYGKIDLSEFDKKLTPPIWASFITGLPPSKHGVHFETRWNNILLNRFEKFFRTFHFSHIPLRRLFVALKFENKPYWFWLPEHIETIFDVVKPSIALKIPSYNYFYDLYKEYSVLNVYAGKEPQIKAEKRFWDLFTKEKDDCLKHLDTRNWKLFMAQFHITDSIGHMYAGNLSKMYECYVQMNDFVNEVKQLLVGNTLVLIVSDHGMRPLESGVFGDHSDYGFYSSNFILNLRNPNITSFKRVILDYAQRK